MRKLAFVSIVTSLATFTGCSCDTPQPSDAGMDAPLAEDANDDANPDATFNDPAAPAPFTDVPQTGRFTVPGLTGQAYVVRTELNVPHIYATNRVDAMRVMGFVMARDRYFQMDLTRRLSQGRISELLGDAALSQDLENRLTGANYMTDVYLASTNAEEAAELDAFAAGINAYVAEVRARRLPAPRELQLAGPLLGTRAELLLTEWTRRDVISTGSTALYGTAFDTGDPSRSRAFERIDALFAGFPDQALRRAGLLEDIVDHYAAPNDISSAAGWGLETAGMGGGDDGPGAAIDRPFTPENLAALRGVLPERRMLDGLNSSLARVVGHLHRDPDEGWGSNEWAVQGSATTDGASLLCGDGHLQLSTPPLFWQLGLDTMLMGGASETTRIVGATIAGLPAFGVGTNGHVAWTQTAYFPDVTDWYTEVLTLDAAGLPISSRYQGSDRPLLTREEPFVIANIPALESVGRTEMIRRFETFDGRWITSIEGTPTTPEAVLMPGQSKVYTLSGMVIPSDVDGDGRVTAVSFYFAPFAGGNLLRAFRGFADAQNVNDFREATRNFIGYGGSMMASDSAGSILYSAYHAVPTRDHLTRGPDNRWVEGADPRRLIDGTRFGSWTIPLDAEGRVDEVAAAAAPPNGRVVPFDQWPTALNPGRQYVVHANNDPANITTDNDFFNEPYYIGGPWLEGYRGARIATRLEDAITNNRADMAEMARIQGDHHSNLGQEWIPVLLDTIRAARTAAAGSPAAGTSEARMAARWMAARTDYEEVERRVIAWRDAGLHTPSGVETFYSPVRAGDAENSVATTVFHAWISAYFQGVMDDEGISGDFSPAPTGDTFRTGTMQLLERGRGATNPLNLGSFNPATNESVFFDDVRTPVVESSREMGLLALDRALAYLRSAPTGPGAGGFGNSDWDTWRWGYRHMVRFDSLIGDALGSDPAFDALLSQFSITPRMLPLMPGLPATDPRASLPHFPRPGDHLEIDAANPGFGLDDWTHGSGPVFRMVIALSPEGVRGENVLPGGQSGFPGDPHFNDQTRLWLANQTTPMRYLPSEVAEGAVSLERFVP